MDNIDTDMPGSRIPPPPLYEDVLAIVAESDTNYLSEQYTEVGLNQLLYEFGDEIVADILKPRSREYVREMDDLYCTRHVVDSDWLCGPQELTFNEPLYETGAEGFFNAYNDKDGAALPGIAVHYIEDVTLYGPDATPVTRTGEYLLPCANGQYRYLASLIANAAIDYTKHNDQYTDPEQCGTVLPLLGFGELNYYYWIVEFLPRLRAAYHHYDVTGKFPTLLINDDESKPFVRETLELFGLSEAVEPWNEKAVHVDKLIVTRGGNRSRRMSSLQPAQVRWLQDTICDLVPVKDHGFADHIFISRKDADRRRITNHDEVIDALPDEFTVYELANYTFEEQVNMFRGAKEVVALHGAGLTNTLWSNNAKVLEIHPRPMKGMYYEIASILQHFYASITYQERNDVHVDTRDITRALHHLSNI